MERMEALIEDLIAAIRENTAAILAGGAAETTRQTGVRAGEPETVEPFGTPVAKIDKKEREKEIDRSIDRSNLFSSCWRNLFDTTEAEIRSSLGSRCQELNVFLGKELSRRGWAQPRGYDWRRNRRLEVAAAVIARHFGEAGQQWLEEALETTREHARSNVYGFFRVCLANSLRQFDPSLPMDAPGQADSPRALLGRLINHLPVPEIWLAEPKETRREVG